MSGPGWDTRSPAGARRPGGRDRLALIVGASLLVLAVLAALTGKVLALNPPTFVDSSPTADHTGRQAPASSPKPPDPESLFLDLPDPPPPASGATKSPSKDRAFRPASASVNLSAGKEENAGGRVAGGSQDIPISAADFRPLPPEPTTKPGSGSAEDLLDDPDCRFSDVARADLEAGVVDEYLISALQAVCQKHSISVNVFKTGHTFGPGLAEGPEIPVGYGNAGGYPNTHYFGRAADIWKVDGKTVEGNGTDPAVVSVGRILAGLPVENRPDVVIGPDAWNQVLGYGPEQGWVIDQDQVALHADHLHVGYWKGDGTPPPRVFLSPEQAPFYTNTAPAGHTRDHANKTPHTIRPGPTQPKPKETRETIEPAKSAHPGTRSGNRPAGRSTTRSVSGPGAATQESTGHREKTSHQRTIIRKVRVQRAEARDVGPGPAKKKPEGKKNSATKPGDPQPPRRSRPTSDREPKQPTPGASEVRPEEKQNTVPTTEPLPQYSTEPEITESGDMGFEAAPPGGETAPEGTDAVD